MKKVSIILLIIVLISGCSTQTSNPTDIIESQSASHQGISDAYYPIVQFEPNTGRNEYYTGTVGTNDFQTISRELEIMSQKHFSTDEYYMSDGQMMEYGDIQDDLLLWKTDELPYSLQPGKDEQIDGLTNVIMTSSVYELDFYKRVDDQYALSGASFAIVLDPLKRNDDGSYSRVEETLSDGYIESFSKNAMETLYKYIQEDERYASLKNVPIVIGVYLSTDPDESKNSGSYIYQSFSNGTFGEVTSVNYSQVIFTSSEAEQIDPITSSEFSQFKNALKENAVESVGAVGYGRYNDDKLTSLNIKITANVKTYVELEAIVSIATSEVNSRFSTPVPITVTIESQDQLEAIIIKERGKDAISSMIY